MTTLTNEEYNGMRQYFKNCSRIFNNCDLAVSGLRLGAINEVRALPNIYLARAQQVEPQPQPVDIQAEPDEPGRRQAEVLTPPESFTVTDDKGKEHKGLWQYSLNEKKTFRDEYYDKKRQDILLAHWNGKVFIHSPAMRSRIRKAKKDVQDALEAAAAR